MYLTREEERMLDGERGEAKRIAMEILLALGRAFDAERLIPIRSAHISGLSYANIGDEGLEFLRDFLRDGRFEVETTLNPIAMDLGSWRDMGIPEEIARKQIEIIEIFERAGAIPTYSCVPYLIGNIPRFGEHVAWAESSAVVFANSILGARTNREGGPSATAAALTGRTPFYGLHLDENRIATKLLSIDFQPEDYEYGLLGFYAGRFGEVIAIRHAGGDKIVPKLYELKLFCAAYATAGSSSLFFMENVTPEYRLADDSEDIHVGRDDIEDLFEREFRRFRDDEIDLIAIGCPHASMEELISIARFLRGKRVRRRLWIFLPKKILSILERAGVRSEIEESGAKLIADTCFVVSPLELLGIRTVLTNSIKAAFYVPRLRGMRAYVASTKECLEVALSG